MSLDMTRDARLAEISATLDSELKSRRLKPEDIEATSKFFVPLETEIARWPKIPGIPDTPAGGIVQLLWFKSHPSEADLAYIVARLRDRSELTRMTAVDALKTTLEVTPERWADSRLIATTRDVLKACAVEETSPLLAGQFSDVEVRFERLGRRSRRPVARPRRNPYIAGPPVRNVKSFFGRDDILNQIRQLVFSSGSTRAVVLHGARRTGKTSLLYRIADGALGDGAVPVFIDMQSVAGARLSTFLRALIVSTWERLGSDPSYVPSTTPDFHEMREYFDVALTNLGNDSLVLLLDEYEVLDRYLDSGFAAQLLSLLEKWPNLFVIFAGSKKLESITNDAYSHLLDLAKYIKITFLEPADARRLVVEPAEGSLRFAPGIPERIIAQTKGHPFYTQLLCQTVFEVIGNADLEVTGTHVDQAVTRFLQNPAPHLVLSWNTLRPEQAAVGSALAVLQRPEAGSGVDPGSITKHLSQEGYPIPLNQAAVQRSLEALSLIDWVEKQRDANEYRFTMELVRRWVVEDRPLEVLVAKQEEELAASAAEFRTQRTSWLIDLIVLAVASALAILGPFGTLPVVLLPFAYFLLMLGFSDSTIGMKVMHIRVAAAPRRMLGPWRRTALAFLYTMHFFINIVVIGLIVVTFADLDPRVLLALAVPLLIEILDNVMVRHGKKRQSLWDRMAGTMLVPSEVTGS